MGTSDIDSAARPGKQDELLTWVEDVSGGKIVNRRQIAGGNRCHSWALDIEPNNGGALMPLYLRVQVAPTIGVEPYTVWREASVYRAVREPAIRMPRLVAAHPTVPAILTERAAGIAEFRHLKDEPARLAISQDFVAALAALHRLDISTLDLGALARQDLSVRAAITEEIQIWRAMYEETERRDPLIDLAFSWLEANRPQINDRAVLAHGDAGPGNFLFDQGRLTALIDWELAHLGDPMDDLAWFSMRCVMEPVPDFAACLRAYEAHSGIRVDRERLNFHRVLVSLRVVVIRHRNVSGLPGNSLVSRALNRRLLVEAIATASGIELPVLPKMVEPETARSPLYNKIIEDIRTEIVPRSTDAHAIALLKDGAKVMKHLREMDRYAAAMEAQELVAINDFFGKPQNSLAEGRAALSRRVLDGDYELTRLLTYFHGNVIRETQLNADAQGGLATRGFPAF
ncbi:phosphotransferase family protein [Chelatococcus asaccharovorans]|uniref:phosphotransferase family protein n=1 Tax=Chelatococcus asaccharovorans TaxID=28210 RepID=UPI00224C7570|nr:phosphotransferase family protein [Chelatococcus asaccharovorans]CAH1663134.1 Predicted kinase, aminoglycoside phosphotransferase (APT) family [Chelatococcus asaccharovorans]CAH1682929.1 Predicted kinase, aminoglycoside phosphotransferase (APT) family [Chelatococcus asaccharovorans]